MKKTVFTIIICLLTNAPAFSAAEKIISHAPEQDVCAVLEKGKEEGIMQDIEHLEREIAVLEHEFNEYRMLNTLIHIEHLQSLSNKQ